MDSLNIMMLYMSSGSIFFFFLVTGIYINDFIYGELIDCSEAFLSRILGYDILSRLIVL